MGQNCACFFKSFETEGQTFNLPVPDYLSKQPQLEHNDVSQTNLSKSPNSQALSKSQSLLKDTNVFTQSKRLFNETCALKIYKHIKGLLFRKRYYSTLRRELSAYQEELLKELTQSFLNTSSLTLTDNKYNESYNPQGWSKYYKGDEFNTALQLGERLFENCICVEYISSNDKDFSINVLSNKAISLYKGSVTAENKRQGYGELITKESKQKGEWLNDRFTGWNSKITSDGQLTIGRYINGLLNGKGECYTVDGYSYKGDFANNMKEGEGIEVMNRATYEGAFKNDMKNGKGRIVFASGDVYEGEFVNGVMEGNGHYIWSKSKHEYIGDYKGGKFHGSGYYKINEEEYYKGEYKEGIKEGQGEMTFANKTKYTGPFVNGKPNGVGMLDNGKNFKGEAEFIDGKLNKKYKHKKKELNE